MESPIFREKMNRGLSCALNTAQKIALGLSLQPETQADVIPTPMNWGNVSMDGIEGSFVYATKRVIGINQAITLKINFSAANASLYWGKNAAANELPPDDFTDYFPPDFYGMSTIANNGTFTIQPNDYVSFGVNDATLASGSFTVTVRNASDADTILDTFTVSWSGVIP